MKSLRLTALTMAALALSSCATSSLDAIEEIFPHPQQKREKPAQSAEIKQPTTAQPVVEQQSTKRQITERQTTERQTTERPTVVADLLPAAPSYQPTTAIPGRSGLRMGGFAPPEEAASAGENATPAPNAAELHGLRSPSLPTSLPLDINGQTKKD